ncbi:peptidoglycan DD-metalloendopeptidase family protein [Hyphococcus sp. DH-69]|uniref:peptidoglycan DD-metalloendopeptidase family protein n=1 Tax=Hyphococcus formosus TaxID=3143534 RepID=UPI00398B304A
MTDEFVQTGQTLTGENSAYCPLERRRRGGAALAAALTVMIAGGGFLIYSAASTPEQATKIASQTPSPVEIASTDLIPAHTAPETEPPTRKGTASKQLPQENAKSAVDAALAESRAARAGTTSPEPIGLIPRIKPDVAPEVAAATTPSDAKALTAPIPVLTAKSAASVTPLEHVGAVKYASEFDAPPPFFFTADIEPVVITRKIPAIAYATDISRAPQEVRIKINKGENFVDALKRAGVTNNDANIAAYAFGEHQDLRRLRPGQELALTLAWPNQTLFQLAAQQAMPQARLMGLEFRADAENRIVLRRDHTGEMSAEKHLVPLTTRVMSIAGQINGSLYMSAKTVGAPDEIIANLADAFAYDVDFQREIFGGDEFEAIFEVRYDDLGKMVSAGDILYARLKWRGRSREKGYYRFSEDGERGDFYDATGQSAKRLLMKTPIDGARLSSGFGTRKHPILGYRRAHKGVDFAAPRGTPIKAAGDGTVLRANRYGSFGNYVKIRHANGYETAYAHLNGFARGIRAGKRVRQGDIIAYVGTTGRSTGPHLHYEVHLNGKAVNPQRLKIATGKQLTGAALERFKAARDRINAMRMPEEEREALYARETVAARDAL